MKRAFMGLWPQRVLWTMMMYIKTQKQSTTRHLHNYIRAVLNGSKMKKGTCVALASEHSFHLLIVGRMHSLPPFFLSSLAILSLFKCKDVQPKSPIYIFGITLSGSALDKHLNTHCCINNGPTITGLSKKQQVHMRSDVAQRRHFKMHFVFDATLQ